MRQRKKNFFLGGWGGGGGLGCVCPSTFSKGTLKGVIRPLIKHAVGSGQNVHPDGALLLIYGYKVI